MKKFLPFILFAMLLVQVSAQTYTLQKTLKWDDTPIIHNPTGSFPMEIYNFYGAQFKAKTPSLPYHSERFQVAGNGILDIEVINAEYEPFDKSPSEDDNILTTDINFETSVSQNRRDYFGNVNFIPIRKTGNGNFERLVSFELRVRYTPQITNTANTRGDNTYTSILSEGTMYKIAVNETGFHKITYDFLKTNLGIAIDDIDPAKIKLYGNGGGPLPHPVITERYDDLEENAIQIVGENDGSFDSGDYILFYAEGPHSWTYNSEERTQTRNTNIYDTKNYYFIKVDGQSGKRVGDASHTISSISNTEYNTTSCDYATRFEEDERNLLADSPNSQGSGQKWYGDIFNPTRAKTYNFNIPNLKTDQPIKMKVEFAARGSSISTFSVVAGGQTTSSNFSQVALGNAESQYANIKSQNILFNSTGESFDVMISYPAVGDGTNKGWLDYIELNVRKNLVVEAVPYAFHDANSLEFTSSGYQLSNANSSTLLWDISEAVNPKLVSGTSLSGSNLSFGIQNDNKLHTFIAFDPNATFNAPEAIGEVSSQNYHGIQDVDMVIIYHNDFLEAAQRLADHRSSHSNLSIELVDIDKLYNEFSSGRVDPTAIRDFAKMLFDRSGQFKYLLLMGDGSFDSRNIEGNSKTFIPVYETALSLHPVHAFPSDDFFTLLTDDDGFNINSGDMDAAVGRIPVKTLQEAQGVVDKIIRYDTQASTLGDWKNRITFIADDQDNNRHLKDADAIANDTRDEHLVFNFDKIYFDAYQQVTSSGDARYPEAQDALNRTMFKGVLALNYMGHGGGRGWAQERVLTNNDISNWTNIDNLPLFVTATCSFAGYDDSGFTSAGEQIMLKPDGGAIGLFTTTRAVFTSSNERLTREVFDTLLQVTNGYSPPIGEILRVAKNNSTAGIENSRKFTLLGDPSLTLTIPELDVVTTSVNGVPIGSQIDTIRALQEVTIEGMVLDASGNLNTSFSGTVYPTVFDKKININTLGQDDDSQVRSFELQKNILFKGKATVTNGTFKFTFIVPKDINYEYGYGKISYYAEDGSQVDARGYYDKIIIGGTDPNGIKDDQGPLVEVYMNDEDFVTGGLTDNNPTLLVKLSDDHGINVAGNSIGHDLTGVLDQNTSNTYILNDFYEAEVDDHRKGSVRFPLFNIAEGLHTVRVKAWDVANNSAEGYSEFVVAGSEDAALDHVLNYPNPFTTCTNFQFEHNMAGQLLDVQVQIFTVSGKLAKTVHTQINADGYRVTDIKWDGTDDYGDRLGRGVYVYKVKVRSLSDPSASIKGESDFEKLVILK